MSTRQSEGTPNAMTIFEPLLLVLALAALGAVGVISVSLGRGNRQRAFRVGGGLGVAIGAYTLVLVVVSLLVTPRVHDPGSPLCFDDWCIDLVSASRPAPDSYEVRLRLSNHARRQPMGERGTHVYVEDDRGHRHEATPDPAELPFSTQLQPGESVETTRRFAVAADEMPRSLFYVHEGFPIQWLVIGEGGWFQPPPSFRLPLDVR